MDGFHTRRLSVALKRRVFLGFLLAVSALFPCYTHQTSFRKGLARGPGLHHNHTSRTLFIFANGGFVTKVYEFSCHLSDSYFGALVSCSSSAGFDWLDMVSGIYIVSGFVGLIEFIVDSFSLREEVGGRQEKEKERFLQDLIPAL